MRQTRAAAAVKATVAKKKVTASSSSKRPRTPPASPPTTDDYTEVIFDIMSLSPRRTWKATEEEADNEYVSGLLSSPSPQTVPLFLTCLHLRSDMETLAQRVAKRARA